MAKRPKAWLQGKILVFRIHLALDHSRGALSQKSNLSTKHTEHNIVIDSNKQETVVLATKLSQCGNTGGISHLSVAVEPANNNLHTFLVKVYHRLRHGFSANTN